MAKRPDLRAVDDPTRARLEIEFEQPYLLGPLFGEYDRHLVAIEDRLAVNIAARGNRVQIEGEPDSAARAKEVLVALYSRLDQGQDVDLAVVESEIGMGAQRKLDGIIPDDAGAPKGGGGTVMIRTRKKTIVPRSTVQTTYMEALARDDMIFALGPAGTGKTYLAVAQAVSMLIGGQVDRLILSRPAVEAGERLGFLPGEAQNTTPQQMKMFLTRFGMRSRMVICGDPNQTDLPRGVESGLADAVHKLEGIPRLATVRFGAADVVRHPLVGRIVEAYEGPGA
jgi:phosphate starvation-inducible PhoH-like protein